MCVWITRTASPPATVFWLLFHHSVSSLTSQISSGKLSSSVKDKDSFLNSGHLFLRPCVSGLWCHSRLYSNDSQPSPNSPGGHGKTHQKTKNVEVTSRELILILAVPASKTFVPSPCNPVACGFSPKENKGHPFWVFGNTLKEPYSVICGLIWQFATFMTCHSSVHII